MAASGNVLMNLLFGTYLLSALMSGIVFKEQGNCVSMGAKYHHPFMQSFTMYIGEALCMVVFIVFVAVKKEKYHEGNRLALEAGKSHKIPITLLIIPTACDFVSSTLSFFSLGLMPVSLHSMIRSGNLVITAIASVVFLKRKLYRHHLLALVIIMAGLITVGLVVISNGSSDDDDSSKMILGIGILFVSFFAHTAQLIVEEKYFAQYHLNPFYVVGIEGLWGILISGAGLAIFNYVPCPGSLEKDCLPNGNLEDISFFFKQVFTMNGPTNITPDQPMLIWMIFAGIIVILLVNATALSITKYVSSLARNVAQVLAPFLVWMASLVIGWQSFLYGQLIGFLVIAFGTCIFNEIIVLPFYGFDQNTKKRLEQRNQQLLISNKSEDENSLSER